MVVGWFNIEGPCLYSAEAQKKKAMPQQQQQQRAEQRFSLARVFGAAALQPFSVLRPFYERRTLLASIVREEEEEEQLALSNF